MLWIIKLPVLARTLEEIEYSQKERNKVYTILRDTVLANGVSKNYLEWLGLPKRISRRRLVKNISKEESVEEYRYNSWLNYISKE